MDIGSIFLILALLLLVGVFVSRPFFSKQETISQVELAAGDHEISALLAERDRLLNALAELDFDNALGKIPAEDYPVQRQVLVAQGVQVLRRLDELQPATGEALLVEDRIEAAIAARRLETAPAVVRSGGNGNGAATPDDEIERLLASRRRERQDKAAGFCPQCGGPVQRGDKFCPKCGARQA
jgi:hypothetical protein